MSQYQRECFNSKKMVQKKLFVLLILFLFAVSCSSDDDGIDCRLFDPAFPSLWIKFVNESGENLIGNGSIIPNEITVEGDFPYASDFQFNPPDEYSLPDSDIRMFDNTIQLIIPNQSTFEYSIRLKPNKVLNVSFDADLVKIPCGISYYLPSAARFEGNPIEMNDVFALQYLVEITLDLE